MTKIISTSDGVKSGLRDAFRKNFNLTQKLVTNDSVKIKFIDNIKNYLGNTISKNIALLIKKNRIIPVECTTDLIKELNSNLKGEAAINPKEYDNVLGFYTGRQNRLYILTDNIQRLIGSNSKSICEVMIHELQHMCCYNFLNQFIDLWKNELYNFYAYFLALLYKAYTNGFKALWNSLSGNDKDVIVRLLDPDNGVKYLVHYLIYNFEYLYCCAGSSISVNDCKAIGDKYSAVLINNGCSESTSSRISSDIKKMAYDIFSGKIGSTYKNGSNLTIINCFREAYLKIFKKDPWTNGTLIYQELIFPSEIVCISSQYFIKNAKYYKFLNQL